ncbi:hypothetical protein ABIB95_004925 [Bradyrhizobium sp. LA2.1]
MRTTVDFAPLWRSTIGFDHLADLVDNIERTSEDHSGSRSPSPASEPTTSP